MDAWLWGEVVVLNNHSNPLPLGVSRSKKVHAYSMLCMAKKYTCFVNKNPQEEAE